jgi:CubicO group peptidase (beta-lactamase class C family)
MFRNYFLLLLLVLSPYWSQSQNLENELENIVSNFELMGMSVWVNTNGSEAQYHYGLKDFNRNLDVNSNTHYRIASISKTFTALGVIKLYDDGVLNLDEDISTYLGYQVENPQFPSTPITTRMLLSHTSSLQDGDGYTNFLNATYSQTPIPNISELLLPSGGYYSSNMWRVEAPGTFFTYSNVNFGLLGTLIEAISGERFDIFMKNEVLVPLGIQGSFNIQDISDINDMAVLYRNNNGNWQAQYDNYQGLVPTPPDLSSYIPGTNGIYFAPQGGLRSTVSDMGRLLNFLKSEGSLYNLSIQESSLNEMRSIQWNYNGTNGNNYFGLFNRWGLGLHHANITSGDQICGLGNQETFIGHPGEAYGLISDAYFIENQDIAFTILINGIWDGYQLGTNSSFYAVEEAIFNVLCNYFDSVLTVKKNDLLDIYIFPNPAKNSFTIQFKEDFKEVDITLFNILGNTVYKSDNYKNNIIEVDVSILSQGIYFLTLTNQNTSFTKKIIIE